MSKYHKILGVSNTASKEVIKSAFRKKALQYHPDRNKSANAESQFIEIHKAYEIISNGKAPKTIVKSGARTSTQATVDPKEKYRNVYSAPTDPNEYKLWRQVAEERARQQAKMNYEQFKNYNEAFRKSNMYPVYKAMYYLLVGFVWTILGGVIAGNIYAFADNSYIGIFMLFLSLPMIVGVYWSYPNIKSMGDMFKNR